MPSGPWVIDVFKTEQGEALVQAFIASLTGRDRDEAFALVKLLEEQGQRAQKAAVGKPGGGTFRAARQADTNLLHVSPRPARHAPRWGDQEARRHPAEDLETHEGIQGQGPSP